MISPLMPPAPATASAAPPPDALRKSAIALETAFLAELLKSAGIGRPSEGFDGGAGETQFASFMADAHAAAMVRRGGLGLATAIESALRARAGDGQ